MSIFISFISVFAWFMLILSGLLLVIRIHGAMNYSDLHQSLDRMNGYVQTFPIITPGIIFITSMCWIIATWNL